MHVFAQSNLEMINQVQISGYRLPRLSSLAQLLSWRCRLFTSRFRASGKTFIAHLVTAGALIPCYSEQSGRTEFLFCYYALVAPGSWQRSPNTSK
jgi:hypothetical protein